MTPRQFSAALALANVAADSNIAAAARLVLLDNVGQREAARRIGIDVAAVSRALKRIAPHVHATNCPTCGRALPKN